VSDKNTPARNIRLTLEYDGTRYAGWQCQNHKSPSGSRRTGKTIQSTIEKALARVVREKVKLTAAGRTDAGVHARAQVANFQTRSAIPASKFPRAINAFLPKDILVTSAQEERPDFNSCRDAKSKIYRYAILNQEFHNAALRHHTYFCPYKLDVGLMRQEAKVLLGRHNFRSFCASASSARNMARTIKRISIKKCLHEFPAVLAEPRRLPLVIIEVEADGFLYNMMRNIAGTLVELGRGRFRRGDIKRILSSRDRRAAGPTLPASGLTLMQVKY